MNTKSGLLGVFVVLALVFASLALIEHGQITTSTSISAIVSTATTTITSTTTGTQTQTGTVTIALTPTTETPNTYNLVFKQITPCPNLGYLAPWSVTLSNGQSITAESANDTQCCSGSPTNPSIITFLVANGNYSYSIMPSSRLTPNAGTAIVDSQEVVINVDLFLSSCGSTTTSGGSAQQAAPLSGEHPQYEVDMQLFTRRSNVFAGMNPHAY